ncbi:hypothetical protein [Jonesia quinghaiensis]|uniref:hypothetical protein n=1 Tax=Jonesia quinghaiensis TaxID=262806 RepID=UPI000424671B|nr:hypothetical protein [Jonesia quinghaiensis]
MTKKTTLLLASLIALALCALSVFSFMHPVHALALGTGAIAALVGVIHRGSVEHLPERPRTFLDRSGARNDIAELSWTIATRDNATSYSGHHRLLTITTTVLAHHNVDVTTQKGAEQARHILGPTIYDELMHRTSGMTTRHVHDLLAALESLSTPLSPTRRKN